MLAGDAGLERNHGPLCLARAEQDRLRAEIDRLRAQLVAQQAVVDAARAFDAVLSHYCDGPERDQLRAALDAAQATQPEGEQAR